MAIGKKERKREAVEETVQVVLFRIGDEEYALGIETIVEVIRPLKITPLPRMPEFVEGVINLRGEIIPVVDMRRRFELPRLTGAGGRAVRMIITRGALSGTRRNRDLLALVADSVQDVLTIPTKNIESAPEAARGSQADFIAGMGKIGDRLVIFLDLAKVLTREEKTALEEAGHGQL